MKPFSYDDLQVLHDIARIIASPRDLRMQLEKVLQDLSSNTGMNRGMISILDRDTGVAILDVAHGVDIDGLDITYLPGEGITGQVAQTGKPMVVRNIGKDKQFLDRTGARKKLNQEDLAFLCVPIIYDEKVVGVLSADKVAQEVDNQEYELKLLGEVAELIAKAVHMRAIEEENRRLRNIIGRSQRPSDEIIGNSKTMKEVFGLVSQVSDSNTTVLIHGETGTGKELVARAIHKNSPRSNGPFVEVNCAAMPDTLIESELFGHERGAFTGANQKRRGRFEEANGGTIFLDEVGELSSLAQAKLLRVIQERQFQPLGSNSIVKVNVRIITATNRDLDQDVASGKFRSDLYYRLNVFPVYMPPLRERGGDIILLADYFVEKYSRQVKKSIKRISTPAIDFLLAYHWPGNVRELENCMERAVLLAGGDTIDSIHLPPSLQMKAAAPEKKHHGKLESLVNTYERSLIIDAMKDAKGNQSQAARLLGTTKRIIQYKVEKYSIDTKRFKAKKA
ncbi:MAG TPA: sigma 54-interacting transcriptional regulator [Deltaproteobacteria bacterium]|nr:sigma 54-interacting transcriptional regulator [Deltaproteobacteria bacterium]HPR54493.1 sigma 54-interacting transcriptional regulator [Deltaproteobacteria bacterium]HXK46601.1 sigma 54-interacting transcriptional regulator [Deltaproteobacteria bacterium]